MKKQPTLDELRQMLVYAEARAVASDWMEREKGRKDVAALKDRIRRVAARQHDVKMTKRDAAFLVEAQRGADAISLPPRAFNQTHYPDSDMGAAYTLGAWSYYWFSGAPPALHKSTGYEWDLLTPRGQKLRVKVVDGDNHREGVQVKEGGEWITYRDEPQANPTMKTKPVLPWNVKPGMRYVIREPGGGAMTYTVVKVIKRDRSPHTGAPVWEVVSDPPAIPGTYLHGKTRNLPASRLHVIIESKTNPRMKTKRNPVNRWGLKLRKGQRVRMHLARGGTTEGVIARFESISGYGKRVILDSGASGSIDDVAAILPKTNPRMKKKRNPPPLGTHVHLVLVKYLGPTDTRGSRVKLISQRFPSDSISEGYGSSGASSTLEQGFKLLEELGYTVACSGETDKAFIVGVRQFVPLKLALKRYRLGTRATLPPHLTGEQEKELKRNPCMSGAKIKPNKAAPRAVVGFVGPHGKVDMLTAIPGHKGASRYVFSPKGPNQPEPVELNLRQARTIARALGRTTPKGWVRRYFVERV